MNANILTVSVYLGFAAVTLSGCGNNIHQVGDPSHPHKILRTAQLDASKLEEVLTINNVQAVINLNGVKVGQSYYEEEKKVVKKLGVDYYDMFFDIGDAKPYLNATGGFPNKKLLIDLIQAIKKVKAEKKIVLIHCKAGADRTSFASALARIIIHGESAKEARKSFSHKFGHLCTGTCTFETIIKSYKPHQKEMDIEEWVQKHYNPEKSVKTYKYIRPDQLKVEEKKQELPKTIDI